MAICGIYLIENDVNDLKYVGLSTNCWGRWNQHCNGVTSYQNSPDHHIQAIDQAIYDIGKSHFTFNIIEECENEKLGDREQYWIAYYNSYYNGYNMTKGGKNVNGEDHPRAKLTNQDVWDIREMYNNKIPFRYVVKKYEQYGITKRSLQHVWKCDEWTTIHMDVYTEENKKFHSTIALGHSEDQVGLSSKQRALKQDEINLIYNDFKSGLTIMQLVKKYNRDYGVIERYINNPVESKVNLKGIKVINIETEQEFPSISAAARWAGCGATTLRRHLYDNKPAGKTEDGLDAHWKIKENENE